MPNPITREVAGRPVWQWGLVVVAGVGLGLVFTRRRAGTTGDGATVDQAAANDGNLPAISAARLAAVTPVPSTEQTSSGPRNNAEWVRAAVARLVQQLGGDPFATEQALSKYVTGQDVTADERGIISEAIRLVGPTPEGSPVVGVIAQPVPAPAPTPTVPAPVPSNNGREVVFTLSRFGGSLERAAEYFYGSPDKWRNVRIYDPTSPDPSGGFLTDDAYRQLATGGLAPDTKLVVGPTDRIAD